jgi:hypothetical protein
MIHNAPLWKIDTIGYSIADSTLKTSPRASGAFSSISNILQSIQQKETTMDITKYINYEQCNKLESSKVAQAIREDYPFYESLMVTPKGSRLKMLGSSVKTDKEIEGVKEEIRVLYLSPSTDSEYGFNACPKAGKCKGSCLQWSGRMSFHFDNRVKKTRAFIAYTTRFIEELVRDIALKAYQSYLNGYGLWVRLNGTSDFMFEKYIKMDLLVADLMGLNGFYDYTKFPLRSRQPSKHYHLSFSVDEQEQSLFYARQWLNAGYPAVIVLNKNDYKIALKDSRIVDGDKNDARFYNNDSIVVLKAKRLFGKGEYQEDGLIRSLNDVQTLLAA